MPATLKNATEFKDCRRHQRISVSKRGRLVAPFSDTRCQFHDISDGGARLAVDRLPDVGDEVAVELPRVGHARGKVVRIQDGHACIAFDLKDGSRNSIAGRLERLSD